MIKLNNKKYLILLILSIVIVITAAISITYAYLAYSGSQNDPNTISSSCYDITFTEGSSINLTSYPMSSSQAFSRIDPYTFTITNNCATGSGYQIFLNISNNTDQELLSYINFSLDGTSTTRLTSLTPSSLPAGVSSSNISTSYVIATGSLPDINTSESFELYLWIDESADTSIMGQTFQGEVMVYNLAEARQLQITNLVTNPSFETTGTWSNGTIDSTHAKYGNMALRLTGTSSSPEITSANNASISLDPTHIYYARYEVYHEGASGNAGIYWPIAEPNFVEGQSIGSANTWNIVSAVNDRSSFTAGSYPIRVDYNNSNATTSVWYDGMVLVDLTEAFGAGNEPTKAWCDANIPFFEGTTLIPYPS